ncbi:hypothetical protein ACFV9C_44430 [Kribbella sp. NPDC059898]|uniref:hypothetical protein n=1 Tax=Kribbella sp. NPDC059898 TaxID=3346995 RepID=UPI003668AD5A
MDTTGGAEGLQESREDASARQERARWELRAAARREVPLRFSVTLGRDLVDDVVSATVVRLPETDWRLGACEHARTPATWHRVQHIFVDQSLNFLGGGAVARFRDWEESPEIDDLRWLETWGRPGPLDGGLVDSGAWRRLAAWVGRHEVWAVLRRGASVERVRMRALGEPKPGLETYRGRVGILMYPAVLDAWNTHYPDLGGLPDRIRVVYLNGDDDHVAEIAFAQAPFAEPFPPAQRLTPDWWGDKGDPFEIGPPPSTPSGAAADAVLVADAERS